MLATTALRYALCATACLAAAFAAAEAHAFDAAWFDAEGHIMEVFEAGGRTYAAVTGTYADGLSGANATHSARDAAVHRNSVRLIDITDPEWPTYVSGAFGHRDGFEIPLRITGMASAEIGGRTYLTAASDDGFVTLDVSDPENIAQVARIYDYQDGFGEFHRAEISIHRVSDAVLAFAGPKIIDVSDPANPAPVSGVLGGKVSGVAEVSGRTYVLTDAGVLDATDPLNPERVTFDDMVTLEMWFESDATVEFAAAARPGAGTLGSAPISDFWPRNMVEIGGRLYVAAFLPADSGGNSWIGLLDVTDPDDPMAVAHEYLHDKKALVQSLGGRDYVFPHPDYPWAGYPDLVFDVTEPGNTAAVQVSREPLDYWREYVSVGGETVPVPETFVYGVELDGRIYAVVTDSYLYDMRHGEGTVVIRDVTDALRGPGVGTFHTDVVPGKTLLLREEHANGTRVFDVVPDLQPGEWWYPVRHDRYVPKAGHPAGFSPGGHQIDSVIVIGERTYGFGFSVFDPVVDITDPSSPVPVEPVMRPGHGLLTLAGLGHRVEVGEMWDETYALVERGRSSTAYRFADAGPTLAGHVLPDAAPTKYGGDLLPAQALWMVPSWWAEVPGQFDGQYYTNIAYGDVEWLPTAMPAPSDAAVTEAGGRPYALIPIGSDRYVYALDVADGTATRLPGSSGFGILDLGGRPHTVAHGPHYPDTALFDVSDPRNPAEVDTKGVRGGFFGLRHVVDVAVTEIGGTTYAVVASRDGGGAVQIIDISDPAELKPVSAVFSGTEGRSRSGTQGVAIAEISGRTYAVTTHWGENAIKIIDISDPHEPVKTGGLSFSQGGFEELEDVRDVVVVHSSGGAYALVTDHGGDAIRVIDIGNPAAPSPAGSVGVVKWPDAIEAAKIGDRTYAAVLGRGSATSFVSDASVVKILDVSNPASARVTSSIQKGGYVDRVTGLDIAEISGRTYALVTSVTSKAVGYVQVTDITNGASVPTAGLVAGSGGFNVPRGGVYEVGAVEVSGRTHMVVVGAAGAQMVDISNPSFPVPGAAIDAGINPTGVEIGGGTYVVSGGLLVTNATDPANPEFVAAVGDYNTYYCEPVWTSDFHTWVPGARC